MKLIFFCLLCVGVGASANERDKRQAGYAFPGPRSEGGGYNRQGAAGYAPQQGPAAYAKEQDESELYQVPRRQFQAHPVQQQYAPAQPRSPAPAPPPVYEAPRATAPAPHQSYSAPAPSPRKKVSSSQNRANKYVSAPQQALNGGAGEEEEEEQGPDALTLLLQDSKFACGSKNDGYYADDSVNCQVFHYCVGGARHSWMCPEGTVFHQVHLNCVPDSQDICSQSPKFHFVNEYLYKPIDYQGPNNTARYAQRYYPDGYVVGDPIVAPNDNQAGRAPQPPPQQAYRPQPQAQSYPAPAPAPAPAPVARPPLRQVAPPPPPPPTYNAPPPQHQPSYNPAPAPSRSQRPARPSRPSYQAENPQNYRGAPAPQAPSGPPAQQVSYQPVNQDNLYQPAAPARRPAAPSRSTGYPAPPRQQYRPSSSGSPASSPAQYQNYGSNQAAGVQYDEDY